VKNKESLSHFKSSTCKLLVKFYMHGHDVGQNLLIYIFSENKNRKDVKNTIEAVPFD
jgi:hypothetical protein